MMPKTFGCFYHAFEFRSVGGRFSDVCLILLFCYSIITFLCKNYKRNVKIYLFVLHYSQIAVISLFPTFWPQNIVVAHRQKPTKANPGRRGLSWHLQRHKKQEDPSQRSVLLRDISLFNYHLPKSEHGVCRERTCEFINTCPMPIDSTYIASTNISLPQSSMITPTAQSK